MADDYDLLQAELPPGVLRRPVERQRIALACRAVPHGEVASVHKLVEITFDCVRTTAVWAGWRGTVRPFLQRLSRVAIEITVDIHRPAPLEATFPQALVGEEFQQHLFAGL